MQRRMKGRRVRGRLTSSDEPPFLLAAGVVAAGEDESADDPEDSEDSEDSEEPVEDASLVEELSPPLVTELLRVVLV